jgi:hypothetical protein
VMSTTAELNPTDSDQDSQVDTGVVKVWASEIVSSYIPACSDTAVNMYIELVQNGSSTFDGDEMPYIELGCSHIGVQTAAVWVESKPGGTADYCEVLLIVQDNASACSDASSTVVSAGTEVKGEKVQRESMQEEEESNESVVLKLPPKKITQAGFYLYQNEPNPFSENTKIGFDLPEGMEASITVYDLTGRVLKSIEGDYVKGHNEVSLDQKEVPVSGVLYYQLDTEDFTATRKMVVIE